MIKGHRIVCFGDEEWTYSGTVQRIARALAAENELIYITSLGVRRPRLSAKDFSKIRRRLAAWATSRDSLHGSEWRQPGHGNGIAARVITPLAVPLYNSLLGTELSGRLVYWQLRRMGVFPAGEKTLLWVTLPTAAPIIERAGNVQFFYHAPDRQAAYPGVNERVMLELEARLAKKASFCVASADNVADELRKLNPHSYCVDHGVDFEHFQAAGPIPEELQTLSRPLTGYVGGLTEWVDQDAIAALAEQRPHWPIVLVGPQYVDISRLLRYANVHWLGPRPYSEVPRYIAAFDACLLPRKLMAWEIYANPLKMLEYFCLGKPVISSALPNVMTHGDLVYVYREAGEIAARVAEALDEPRELSERRREVARRKQHGHEVEQISVYIEAHMRT